MKRFTLLLILVIVTIVAVSQTTVTVMDGLNSSTFTLYPSTDVYISPTVTGSTIVVFQGDCGGVPLLPQLPSTPGQVPTLPSLQDPFANPNRFWDRAGGGSPGGEVR